MYKPNYFQRRTKFQGPRTNHRIKSIDVQVINSSGENLGILPLKKSVALYASLIFLIIDVIWLSFATKSFYRPLIGNLLADKPVMWAAALFYILYVFGMALVVIQPCVDSGNLMKTLYTGFIFGLVAYGTYNLTNMAVLKGWSPTVTFVDMFWGGSLTAVSATSGLYLAKKIVHF